MSKILLIDTTHRDETRVVVLNRGRIEEFDHETTNRKPLKGNIYLAKVTRVEPSLQAAFVEYGGNRHGFLAFSEIHPDYYRIPVEDREALIAEEQRAAEAERAADDAADAQGGAHEISHGEGAPDTRSDEFESHNGDGADAAPHETAENGENTGESDGTSAAWNADVADVVPTDAPASDAPTSMPYEVASDEPGASEAPIAFEPDAPARVTDAFHGGENDHGTDAGGNGADGASSAEGSAEGTSEGNAPSRAQPARARRAETSEDIGEELRRRRVQLRRRYKIQEVIKRRQIILVQVTKEERGTKGAALTTYLSLAGRYCVLMPNTGKGGGISRKITSQKDRHRLKQIVDELDVTDGMSVILRTAGQERSKAEVKRDYEYLVRLWEEIRAQTLASTAPALIYEEANAIKRAIRDLYGRDVDEVVVDGESGYKEARGFMRAMMPSHVKRVRLHDDPAMPMFHRFQVESQLDTIYSPTVQLRSGGSIVINQTEALVAIDVNSGRATRERNIEETATKTNLEAADEVARQLRLRDLAGLIVIDFIDMEDSRNIHAVERRLKEAVKDDRARIQIGRISQFGLLEMSRQRLRPSVVETSTERCPTCNGTGRMRSPESSAMQILRAVEDEGQKRRAATIRVTVPTRVALHMLNQSRKTLLQIEARNGFEVEIAADDHMVSPDHRIEVTRVREPGEAPPVQHSAVVRAPRIDDDEAADDLAAMDAEAETVEEGAASEDGETTAETQEAGTEGERHDGRRHDGQRFEEGRGDGRRGRRRRRRGRRDRDDRPSEGGHGERRPGEHRDDEHRHDEHRHAGGSHAPHGTPHGQRADVLPVAEGGEETEAPIGIDAGGEPRVEGGPPHGGPGGQEHGDGRRRRRRGRRGGRRRRRRGDLPGQDGGPAQPHAANTAPDEGFVGGDHILGPAIEPPEEEFIDAGPPPEGWRPRHAEPDMDAATSIDADETEARYVPPPPPAPEPPRAAEPAPKAPEPEPQPPSGPPKRGWWNRLTG